MLRRVSLSLFAAAIFVSPSSAAKLKTWNAQGASAFADARFENAVINNQGAIRLARPLKPLAEGRVDAAQVWDMIEDKQGNLYVATGGPGKVLKVNPAGEVSTLYQHKTGPVLSLALGNDGSLFAGTGPDGLIVRISPQGEAKTFCETEESYIWALAFQDDTGALFAATGPKGRIVRVGPDGKPTAFFQSKQEHVLCLALDNGLLYAGTDKQGLVYRIDEKGKGFVLYQAPQGEVRSLLVTPEAIYAGTSAPTKKRGATANAPATSPTRDAAATSTSPPAKEENSVYRIAKDGAVREIFREKAQMLSLAKQKDKLIVGTGPDGKLFEVDEATRDFAEIARPDAGQVMRLLRRNDGSLTLATGDSGRLFSLLPGVAPNGTVVSEVFDAKLISRWGTLTARTELPNGSAISLSVRGGNTSEPDATWTDWKDEASPTADGSRIDLTCRFLQFRATLKSADGVSPVLNSVALRYTTINQSPEIASVEVPDWEANPPKEPKKLKLAWKATDPNEDELTYDLWVRKDGWNDWARIEEGLTKSDYEWDTTAFPSGSYRMKLVASDRTDNPDETALKASREFGPVFVAHQEPQVSIKVVSTEKGKATVEVKAAAPLVRLASASFSVNGKKWENVFPTDGLFDGKEKTFRFQVANLQPGANVLVVRVKDVAANIGSADVLLNSDR